MFGVKIPNEFAFVQVRIDSINISVLHPDERELARSFSAESRREEFLAGRCAARQAINTLGLKSVPAIMKGSLGEPLWPEGICGSITHSDDIAIALVAKNSRVRTVGIDLQCSSAFRLEDISEIAFTPAEITRLVGEKEHLALVHAAKLFSIKEAALKAYMHLIKRPLTFRDLELRYSGHRCKAILKKPYYSGPVPHLIVRWQQIGDCVFSYAYL